VIREVGLTKEEAEKANFMKGRGCNSCQKTGFRGRIGIYELLLVDAKTREMIFRNESTAKIREYAIGKGMKTLFMDGVAKVSAGYSTFEEVYRVAKRTEQD
jgi:type IV pilus assembly protein PilB